MKSASYRSFSAYQKERVRVALGTGRGCKGGGDPFTWVGAFQAACMYVPRCTHSYLIFWLSVWQAKARSNSKGEEAAMKMIRCGWHRGKWHILRSSPRRPFIEALIQRRNYCSISLQGYYRLHLFFFSSIKFFFSVAPKVCGKTNDFI